MYEKKTNIDHFFIKNLPRIQIKYNMYDDCLQNVFIQEADYIKHCRQARLNITCKLTLCGLFVIRDSILILVAIVQLLAMRNHRKSRDSSSASETCHI